MEENEGKLLEQIVLTRVMRLNLLANGITVGLLFGLGLFLPTIVLVLKGGPVVGPHLELLSQFLPGYEVTVGGSFVGLGYGFVLGFILGAFVALIYNRVADYRSAIRLGRARK
jgi:hypothetical protein